MVCPHNEYLSGVGKTHWPALEFWTPGVISASIGAMLFNTSLHVVEVDGYRLFFRRISVRIRTLRLQK